MIEDLFAEHGVVPDIDDDRLGAAYDSCPAIQKSVIKNAVSLAYALAQTGMEQVSVTQRFGHVQRSICHERLEWAFFAVDLRRFTPSAVFSAMVLALVAKVETLVVHVTGPVTDAFLFGCDFLSVDQIFTGDARRIVDLLATAGRGIGVDLAGLDLALPRQLRPDPADYGVLVQVPDSDQLRAYRAVTAETKPQSRPYLAYGGAPGSAPVVMDERFLGCWVWDAMTPDTFRHVTSTFF